MMTVTLVSTVRLYSLDKPGSATATCGSNLPSEGASSESMQIRSKLNEGIHTHQPGATANSESRRIIRVRIPL